MKNKYSWVLLTICAVLAFVSIAVAGDVPAAAASEFGNTAASAVGALNAAAAANNIWLILAGQGTWGLIFYAVLRFVWKWVRPYVDEWVKARRLQSLYEALEAGVSGVQATYVDAIKNAVDGDGKLTEAEKAEALRRCQVFVIDFMKSRGVDVVKEYGLVVLNMLIEWALSKLKADNAALKAALAPLDALPS